MSATKAAGFVISATLALAPSLAVTHESCSVVRIDDETVELRRTEASAVDVWLSTDTVLDRADTLAKKRAIERVVPLHVPAATRRYLILVTPTGRQTVVAERLLPLLTDRDYQMLAGMHLESVVDLRALPERELVPDQIDDRTGALFLSNDYSLHDLMSHMGPADGEDIYSGLEKLLVPQFRMALRRILANKGAVVFHDVWGQDRAGIFAALIYDVVGVDRATIRQDFHLSQTMRRPEFEIPKLDPADHPGNPIVKYYASKKVAGQNLPEPLYTPSGASHIDRFLKYMDAEYGGSEKYFSSQLGFTAGDIDRLRTILLE